MANYDFMLNKGHGTAKNGSYDPGASITVNSVNYREATLVSDYVDKVAVHVRRCGLNPHVCNANFADNCFSGNTYKYGFALSHHINAGGGQRSEIFVPFGEKNFTIELGLLEDLKNIANITNGGIKSRNYNSGAVSIRTNGVAMSGLDYYKENRNAWAAGVSLSIVESGFIDSPDRQKFIDNMDKLAEAEAKRLVAFCGKAWVPVVTVSVTPYRVRTSWTAVSTQKNAYAILSNAKACADLFKAEGYKVYDNLGNLVYTPTTVAAPAPAPTVRYLNLKPHVTKWNVYPTSKAPVVANKCGEIKPSLFGGLSYQILANPQTDVYTIETSSFGRVNIYAPRDNDSTITNSPVYK